jgi:hypothetical protein
MITHGLCWSTDGDENVNDGMKAPVGLIESDHQSGRPLCDLASYVLGVLLFVPFYSTLYTQPFRFIIVE